jgi:hypothetical protein
VPARLLVHQNQSKSTFISAQWQMSPSVEYDQFKTRSRVRTGNKRCSCATNGRKRAKDPIDSRYFKSSFACNRLTLMSLGNTSLCSRKTAGCEFHETWSRGAHPALRSYTCHHRTRYHLSDTDRLEGTGYWRRWREEAMGKSCSCEAGRQRSCHDLARRSH